MILSNLFRPSHHGLMPGLTDEALAVVFLVIVLLAGWHIFNRH